MKVYVTRSCSGLLPLELKWENPEVGEIISNILENVSDLPPFNWVMQEATELITEEEFDFLVSTGLFEFVVL